MSLKTLIVLLILALAGIALFAPDRATPLLSKLGSLNGPAEETRIYKWRDNNGDWQYSNTPPPAGIDYQVQNYRSDANIVPSTRPVTSTEDSGQGNAPGQLLNRLGAAGKALQDARAVQGINDERQNRLDQQIDAAD